MDKKNFKNSEKDFLLLKSSCVAEQPCPFLAEIVLSSHAMMLGASELIIGGLLHFLRVPFRGHFLSLNQIYLMTKCLRDTKNPLEICTQVAFLKLSFSKGLMALPAVSIYVQGLLFQILNRTSVYLAAAVSGLWAFLNPFLFLQIFSLGKPLDFLNFINSSLSITKLLIGFVFIKIFLSFGVVFFANNFKAPKFYERLGKVDLVDKYNFKKNKIMGRIFYTLMILFVALFHYFSSENIKVFFVKIITIGVIFLLLGILQRFLLKKLSVVIIHKANLCN